MDVAEVGTGVVYSCSLSSRGSTARGSGRWERGGHGIGLEALLEIVWGRGKKGEE